MTVAICHIPYDRYPSAFPALLCAVRVEGISALKINPTGTDVSQSNLLLPLRNSFVLFTHPFSSVSFTFLQFCGSYQMHISCAVHAPGNLQVIGIHRHITHVEKAKTQHLIRKSSFCLGLALVPVTLKTLGR